MNEVIIYTDGACSGNPGPGGWAAILTCNGVEKELSGSEAQTTNNRMELTAVISGLEALKRPCRVIIVSDSSYVCNAVNKNWLKNWKAKGWKRSGGELLNVDLWQKLDSLLAVHEISFEWIKGHDGHPYNERCDTLAVGKYKKYLK